MGTAKPGNTGKQLTLNRRIEMNDKIIYVNFGKEKVETEWIEKDRDDVDMIGTEVRALLIDPKTGKRFRMAAIVKGTQFIN